MRLRRTARWRGSGILVTAVLVLTACTSVATGSGQPGVSRSPVANPSSLSPTSSPSPSQSVAPAQFSDCSSVFNPADYGIPPSRRSRLKISCAKIAVPLDYSKPTGQTIPIYMVRIHDDGETKPLGSLLVNPGGPGGSGVLLALSLAGTMSEDVLDRYDLIGFDPRGVSLSGPVKCLTNAQTDQLLAADYDVRTQDGLNQSQAIWSDFTNSCVSKYGSALTHYTTVDTARDMDRIRQAVGDTQLHYLGFSYGTELGGVYAHLFPSTVGVMVLDGAVDPTTENNTVAANEGQIKGFEEAFGQYSQQCSKRPTCQSISDPGAALEALQKSADADPIPTTTPGDSRKATGGDVITAALSALYTESTWPTLDSAITLAQNGDAKGIFQLTDQYAERDDEGNYTNILDMLQVVSCNDSASAPSAATIMATASSWATKYPLFGLNAAQALGSCATWPQPRTVPPQPTAPSATPILVLGNLNDPATPYVGSQNLVKTLGGQAELLTWNGQGHTSYGESSCIDDKVNAYLVAGTLPPSGTVCQ